MIKMEELYPLILEAFALEKEFVLPVHGTSMQPLLHTGDMVTLRKIEKLKKGDIVLYKRKNGQFVLHRIQKMKENEIYFVGDHQTKLESGITLAQCIGIVVAYKKQGKEKQYTLKNLSYKIYKFFIRSKIFRGAVSKIL